MTKADMQIYVGVAGVAVSLYVFWRSKETVKEAAVAVGEALDVTSSTNIASKAVHKVTDAIGVDFDGWADGIFRSLGLGEYESNKSGYEKKAVKDEVLKPVVNKELFPAIDKGIQPIKKTGGILHG